MTTGEADRYPAPPPQGLVVGWAALSLGLAVIATASLGTLITVVSIKDVDVLSTVALALAVVAFAAQLIVSLAQAQTAAQQLAQAERINSQTQTTLVEVRTTSQALLTNQTDQFDKVLGAALRAAIPEAVREVTDQDGGDTPSSVDLEALAERLESRLSQVLGAWREPHAGAASAQLALDTRVLFELARRVPPTYLTQVNLRAGRLTDDAKQVIQRIGTYVMRRGAWPPPEYVVGRARGELIENRMISLDVSTDGGRGATRLTISGARVASLLLNGAASEEELPEDADKAK